MRFSIPSSGVVSPKVMGPVSAVEGTPRVVTREGRVAASCGLESVWERAGGVVACAR